MPCHIVQLASSLKRSRLLGSAGSLILVLTFVVAAPTPAMAAPPDMWAFAHVDDPMVAPFTVLSPAYQASSPATTATGGRFGVGRFQVRWKGIGVGRQGNVHVTAVGTDGKYCVIVNWGASGGDQIVNVQCFAPGGGPDDSPFTVVWTMFTTVPLAPGSFASVHYGAGIGVIQSYNSTGSGVTATPLGTGVTAIRFEKVGVGHSLITGNVQVTALSRRGFPRWCKVGAWDDSGTDMIVIVYCFDASGSFLDSDFTASYHRERPVVADFGPPKYFGYVWSVLPLPANSLETNFNYPVSVGANVVTVSGPHIEVLYPQLVLNESHVQVTAKGADPNYCTLARTWNAVGPDYLVDVLCFDPAGGRAPNDAFVTLTNRD
jgi:hypothetical protein